MTRSPRELATQKIQLRKQQEKLLSDLLTVVDALDRAAEHWQQAAQRSDQAAASPVSWWQRWRQRLGFGDAQPNEADKTAEVVTSARDGIEMIRESMLAVLSQHQVEPLLAKGQPFDPSQMHALGQQADASVSPNTVVQEVVRGYRWQDRILREAQVIVAAAPAEAASPTEAASPAEAN
ncbi:MAG: nucleotide exchange factor GrpE [Leptolyngbya sp. SIO4C1]|nr:nucleotide exchange factor GrpE [Leptolyngbya sp. SIO4C1]